MTDPFVGEIAQVGFNYAPYGWAICDGSIVPIRQYTALFSLLGTTYGGDGVNTFGLPDLRSRIAVNQGQGAGLSQYQMGQKGGVETVALSTQQLPPHNHTGGLSVTQSAGSKNAPNGVSPGIVTDDQGNPALLYNADDGKTRLPMTVLPNGGSQPHANLQPYTTVNYIIAFQGVFPQRP